MQLLGVDGFILITTPQKVSSINAIRSGLMAKRLNMFIYGIVENMSKGNHEYSINVAKELNTKFLGSISYNERIEELEDKGLIPVLNDTNVEEEFSMIINNLSLN